MKNWGITVMVIEEPDDGLSWYHDIWNLVEKGEYPAEASKKDWIVLQRLAAHYIICGGRLYRRSHCGLHKLCIHGEEAKKVMQEIHEDVYGPHMNCMMLAKKILRQSYFWSTMKTECVEYVQRSSTFHRLGYIKWLHLGRSLSGNRCHRQNLTSGIQWPLVHHSRHLLLHQVGRGTLLCDLNLSTSGLFHQANVIYWYGVPQVFMSDNGVHFKGQAREVLKEFQI